MKYNNEVIERAITEALAKRDNGFEIDRDELLRTIMNDSDKDFGIDRKYTEEELQHSVYIHINKKDGYKVYVGQTGRRPEDRWRSRYNNQYLGNSIKKHKWDWEKDFSHIVLCYGLTQEEADALEIALIAIFKSTNKRCGYNVANGGNSVGQHSEETKKKIGEGNKGKQVSEETKKKIGEGNKGKQVSEESRKKMSEAKKGQEVSEETKKKISESLKGENSYNYGKHLSEETKKKISDSKKGKKFSNEHKRKIGDAHKGEKHYNYGKHLSNEQKRKISKAHKGKELSNEHKRKIGNSKRGENNSNSKNVYCDGKIFVSVTQCAEFYNVKYKTMAEWLRKNKIPTKFQELGLRYATPEDIQNFPLYKEDQAEIA